MPIILAALIIIFAAQSFAQIQTGVKDFKTMLPKIYINY
jgi:hypothetical protein